MAQSIKIVSGGQTGVDRAALDAALDRGVACGGWCPAKRVDELGTIPDRYPLQILKRGSLRARTLRNVEDSDATAIFYFDELEGGTAATVGFCLKLKKPFKLIDASEVSTERAIELLLAFANKHRISVLNVAGPRASKEPRGYQFAYDVISGLVDRLDRAGAQNR
jgi:hypothetical protein